MISSLSYNSPSSISLSGTVEALGFLTWYFRLGELLSPERKHQETHLCSCAKSRLCELRSPERDNDLVWANQPSLSESSPRFSLFATVSVSPRRNWLA
ncbi:hypothetical protein DEO72_LG2g2993 [Vigna unguiculata]|uniref:Uncharacterized protein n=1 Tax=Vigna unguiculata TaxID=3917 RepID=A0A4D6L2D9_VIGUN|nr:hypothetical protein DEO72_LG2g2993 [Vigna unguiculata]